jgi:hypothetical protein
MVAELITNGHRDAAHYGLAFFADAYRSVYEERYQRMKAVSIAVRAAGADEKGFKRFLSQLENVEATDEEMDDLAQKSLDTVAELMEKYG